MRGASGLMPKSPAKRKAAPPRWKRRPSSLVCAWFNPSLQKRKRVEASGCWQPWGHDVQVCGVDTPGHLSGGDVGCRLTWRTAQCLPKDRASRLGGNCWSRGQKVSLLLSFAQVECRLSSAPPISMTTLSTQIAVLPTRCLAHCLQAGIQRH